MIEIMRIVTEVVVWVGVAVTATVILVLVITWMIDCFKHDDRYIKEPKKNKKLKKDKVRAARYMARRSRRMW